jgi:putative hydrolase of the HAD superfamily
VRITSSAKALIFDADDTLWENNVVLERVIEDFLDWVAHPTLDRGQVRAVLDEIETANALTHGYGVKMLLRSLHDCFERLQERPAEPAERAAIDDLAAVLTRTAVELIPGVEETLVELGARYDLLLLTKGDPDEQQRKIDASRLAHHFDHIHVVPEKNAGTYTALIEQHGLAPDRTWMIGNSPRSDVRPARAAGLNAVFIPNQHTWVLEHDEVATDDERILTLATFAELLDHF